MAYTYTKLKITPEYMERRHEDCKSKKANLQKEAEETLKQSEVSIMVPMVQGENVQQEKEERTDTVSDQIPENLHSFDNLLEESVHEPPKSENFLDHMSCSHNSEHVDIYPGNDKQSVIKDIQNEEVVNSKNQESKNKALHVKIKTGENVEGIGPVFKSVKRWIPY